ncbi:hypothetical protein CONLIGDRAFT_704409 [Coniochaeta ligniaria NRRL 30616]|uniref:Uncharacterized protein n=1 Tax=Coniochaeta ligniaria NRRL 30616 TaxID=1408157 RepID=A0A1J7J714_9PEZI|nr:hypothetical protein CONLIGDRAFT_704409 [Coniochaeta ligniaria NRRL 30616]
MASNTSASENISSGKETVVGQDYLAKYERDAVCLFSSSCLLVLVASSFVYVDSIVLVARLYSNLIPFVSDVMSSEAEFIEYQVQSTSQEAFAHFAAFCPSLADIDDLTAFLNQFQNGTITILGEVGIVELLGFDDFTGRNNTILSQSLAARSPTTQSSCSTKTCLASARKRLRSPSKLA